MVSFAPFGKGAGRRQNPPNQPARRMAKEADKSASANKSFYKKIRQRLNSPSRKIRVQSDLCWRII